MTDYRKLDVWRQAHELALEVHRLSVPLSDSTDAGMLSDVRRAAADIPLLVVMGCDGETSQEFAAAMRSAASSVHALGYRLLLARDAGALPSVPYAKLEARVNQLRAMLAGLNRTVRLRIRSVGGPAERNRATAATPATARPGRAVRDAGSSPRESRPRPTS